jgi:rhomboid family GlyGly-CTERM serine protease
MGLYQDRKIAAGIVRGRWLVPAFITIIACVVALGGDDAREWLRYDRQAIANGEYWRLLGGHITHMGVSHLALNIAGLYLVWMLVGSRLSIAGWIWVLSAGVAGIDAGFWLLDKNLVWYVGLSGLLHTLLVAGAIAGLWKQRGESLAILLIVMGKIAYEQIAGPMPGSEMSSGGPVVVNAHLYGALAGLICGMAIWRRVARAGPI